MKYLYFVIILVFFVSCKSNNTYIIHGTFSSDQDEEYIVLQTVLDTAPEIDSVRIVDGKFTFTGEIENPDIYALSYSPSRSTGIFVFILEPGELNITIDPNSWFNNGGAVQGGLLNAEYDRVSAIRREKYTDKQMELFGKLRNANEDEKPAIQKQVNEIVQDMNRDMVSYIDDHPESAVSLQLLMWNYFALPFEDWAHVLSVMSPELRQSAVYNRMESDYYAQLSLQGKTPKLEYTSNPSFLDVDFQGKSINKSLAEINPGKVLYVDVWSTSCGPCLMEFPYSDEVHESLDLENIEFVYLCVSSTSEEQWKEKIKEFKLSGEHFLLNRENAAKFYEEMGGIVGNPYYFIIGKDGEIAVKNAPRPSSGKVEQLLTELANV